MSTSPALAATAPVVVVDQGRNRRVRWHLTPADAAIPATAVLIASARGVHVGGWLNDVPDGWADAALRTHARLKADPSANLSGMATHQPSGTRAVDVGDPLGRW